MLSYVFPIYPNKEQKAALETAFDLCRFTYNALLEELQRQGRPDRGAVQHKIVELEEKHPELRNVYSKTLQYESYRLFSNLMALSRLKRNGRKVGKLRFKGRDRFRTITYNQSGFTFERKTEKRATIHLSKIGDIRVKTHREIVGRTRQVVVKRSADRWYIILQTNGRRTDLAAGNGVIGIDLGIEAYLTQDNGVRVENPRTLRECLDGLRAVQQRLSRQKKGSRNREKTKMRLQRLHEKIANKRKDFIQKTTTDLIRKNRFIAVENLNIKEMMERPYRNARGIADASWGMFLQVLRYKAGSAGCEVVEVDPRGTSMACSNCGAMHDMPLYIREYKCDVCEMCMDRDQNAAINILKRSSEGPERARAEDRKAYPMKQEASGFSPR